MFRLYDRKPVQPNKDYYDPILREIVKEGLSRAHETTKKALFIVGEDHVNLHARFIELYLMDCCETFGINNLAVEFASVERYSIKLSEDMKETHDWAGVNSHYFLRRAVERSWQIAPVDTYSSDNCFGDHHKFREKAMVDNILHGISDHAVFIVGNAHMQRLWDDHGDALASKFELVMMNTVDYSRHPQQVSKEHRFCMSSANVHQLYPGAEPRALSQIKPRL